MDVDESEWPLVVIDVHRRFEPEEIEALLEAMGDWMQRGEHVIVLHSHTPSSLGRQGMERMKQWQDAHKALFESTCRGMGFMTDHMGPLRRFAVSAMMSLMGKMAVPITFHPSRATAIRWAQDQLTAGRGMTA